MQLKIECYRMKKAVLLVLLSDFVRSFLAQLFFLFGSDETERVFVGPVILRCLPPITPTAAGNVANECEICEDESYIANWSANLPASESLRVNCEQNTAANSLQVDNGDICMNYGAVTERREVDKWTDSLVRGVTAWND